MPKDREYYDEELVPIASLEAAGVSFIRLTHEPAVTMELCRGIGGEYGARHCKNLFLTNKHGTKYYLLLMDPDKPYRTSEVSRRLGSTRLSFAGGEAMREILGLHGGAVSVMGLTLPCAREAYDEGRLAVAIDSDLLKWKRICVHPNTENATLVLKTDELISFITRLGYRFSAIEV